MKNSDFHIIARGPKPWDNPVRKWQKLRKEYPGTPFVKDAETGRNDACPCNSGKKYKKCHGGNA
jgi:hypothetical protein